MSEDPVPYGDPPKPRWFFEVEIVLHREDGSTQRLDRRLASFTAEELCRWYLFPGELRGWIELRYRNVAAPGSPDETEKGGAAVPEKAMTASEADETSPPRRPASGRRRRGRGPRARARAS